MNDHRNDALRLTENPLLLIEPISRSDAQAQGLQFFLTTEECHRGHVAPRNVENGACVLCEAENHTGLKFRPHEAKASKGS